MSEEVDRGDFIEDLDDANRFPEDDVEDIEENDEDYQDDIEENEDSEEEQEEESEEEETTDDVDSDNNQEFEEEAEEENEESHTIPKSRLDEVIAQREAEKDKTTWLEAQLEKFIERDATPEVEEIEKEVLPEYDFDNKEIEYVDALLEGDSAKAAGIRKDINTARSTIEDFKLNKLRNDYKNSAKEQSQEANDKSKFDDLVELYKGKYAFLDDSHDNYNEEAVDTINTLMTGLIAQGKSKAEALRNAVSKLSPIYDLDATKNKSKPNRKKTAVKKHLNANKKQPPKNRGKSTAGRDTFNAEDIEKMSLDDFRKLPSKLKKQLRGD